MTASSTPRVLQVFTDLEARGVPTGEFEVELTARDLEDGTAQWHNTVTSCPTADYGGYSPSSDSCVRVKKLRRLLGQGAICETCLSGDFTVTHAGAGLTKLGFRAGTIRISDLELVLGLFKLNVDEVDIIGDIVSLGKSIAKAEVVTESRVLEENFGDIAVLAKQKVDNLYRELRDKHQESAIAEDLRKQFAEMVVNDTKKVFDGVRAAGDTPRELLKMEETFRAQAIKALVEDRALALMTTPTRAHSLEEGMPPSLHAGVILWIDNSKAVQQVPLVLQLALNKHSGYSRRDWVAIDAPMSTEHLETFAVLATDAGALGGSSIEELYQVALNV